MCYAGARNDSELQLKKVLNYDGNFASNDEFHEENLKIQEYFNKIGTNGELNIANNIFLTKQFGADEKYLELLKKFYIIQSECLNFDAVENSIKIINDWVAEKTKNKIQNLVSSDTITPFTRLLLISAIYFKCDWENKFKEDNTYKAVFNLSGGTKMDVNMMRKKETYLAYSNEPDGLPLAACTLPYAGDKISMTIILPHDDQNLVEIESKIDDQIFKKIFEHQEKKRINLYLPRFKFEKSYEVFSK